MNKASNLLKISNANIVLFLFIILIFALIIIFVILEAKKPKPVQENLYLFGGRNPNGKFNCCGNIDWYLGPKAYKKDCPGTIPPAFQDVRDYYASIQENFTNAPSNDPYKKKGFNKQVEECAQKGLKPAYNPSICTKDNTNLVPEANCKCIDEFGSCKECFPKVSFD